MAKRQRKTIKAPRHLCLYNSDECRKTLDRVNAIYSAVMNEGRYVLFDMSETEVVTAAAGLYLIAIVTTCQCQYPSRLEYPNESVELRLPENVKDLPYYGTGFLDALKKGGKGKLKQLDAARSPFKTGNDPDEDYKKTVEWFGSLKLERPPKLFSAIQEAYLNVSQHAYWGKETSEFLSNRWWQYAFYRKSTSQVVFLLMDLGRGIHDIDDGLGFIERHVLGDAKKIETAMRTGWSRTKEPGRGRGSGNMKEPVNMKDNNDNLLVLSGSGGCEFVYGRDVEFKSLGTSMKGTLIEWSLTVE